MIQPDEIRRRVEDLLEKHGVTTAPVPVEKIARSLGARMRFSPLDEELSGMIYIKGDTPIIGVNSQHHPNRQRFTIAHEIGHLLLHRAEIIDQVHVDKRFPVLMRDANSATGTERMEIEANQFASELLIPSFLLAEMLNKQGFDIDDEKPLERLAKKFRVSRQALEFRIRNMVQDQYRRN